MSVRCQIAILHRVAVLPANFARCRIISTMNLEAIQAALRDAGDDGWLFYDHHHRDPIGERILGLDPKAHITRRWYYYIPAQGEPRKLVHRIEQGRLDSLPGSKGLYSSWQELAGGLELMLKGVSPPRHAVLAQQRHHVRVHGRCGNDRVFCAASAKQIVSSADLVSQFEAVLTEEQIASHTVAQKAPSTPFSKRPGARSAAALRPATGHAGRADRIRHGAVPERCHALRGTGVGERAQCERECQLLRFSLRADRGAHRAHSPGRLPADRYLGQAGQA